MAAAGFSILPNEVGELLFRCGGGEDWGVILGEAVALWGLSTRLARPENPGTTAAPPAATPVYELKKFGDAEVLLTEAERFAGTNSGDCGVTFFEEIGEPRLIFENGCEMLDDTGVLLVCRFWEEKLSITDKLEYNFRHYLITIKNNFP